MNRVKKISLNEWCIYIAIMIGIIVRVYMVANHFTHVDDVGAINDLMQRKLNSYAEKDMFWGFWTYAPLQIFFSGLLVNINYSYLADIVLGRIPSLLCGVTMLFVALKVLKVESKKADAQIGIICIPIVLCALSWENIIYSAQMEPYEIVVLCGFILFAVMQSKFYERWSTSFGAIIVLSVCCYAHFQFFMLVFSMYVALFFSNLKEKKNLIRICSAGAVNALISLPLLIEMKNTGLFERSLNWNIGIGGKFYFSLPEGNITEKVSYIFNFFTTNTYLIYKYFLTISDFKYVGGILTIILLAISILGVVYAHRKNVKFAIYFDVLTLLNLLMICRGSLTYGPSRHMIFVFPTLILLVLFGLQQIIEIKQMENQKKIILKAIPIIVSVIMTGFVISVPNEIAERKNYVSETEINELAVQYSPDFIYGFDWTSDLYGMDIDGYSNKSAIKGQGNEESGWCVKLGSDDGVERFMIISRTCTDTTFLEATTESDLVKCFVDKLNTYGFSDIASKYPNYTLIYQKEIISGEETEYASDYYSNYGNGLCLYIFECN